MDIKKLINNGWIVIAIAALGLSAVSTGLDNLDLVAIATWVGIAATVVGIWKIRSESRQADADTVEKYSNVSVTFMEQTTKLDCQFRTLREEFYKLDGDYKDLRNKYDDLFDQYKELQGLYDEQRQITQALMERNAELSQKNVELMERNEDLMDWSERLVAQVQSLNHTPVQMKQKGKSNAKD